MNDFFFESVAWQYKTAAVEDLWCLSTAEKFRSGPNVEISGHCWSDVCHRFKVWNMHELPRNSWNLKDKLYWKWKKVATIGFFISCLLGPIHNLVRALLLDFFRDQKENCTSIDFSIKWIEYSGCIGADFLMVSNCVTTNRNAYKTKIARYWETCSERIQTWSSDAFN